MENRLVKLDSTYNFRDMGDYKGHENKRVKKGLLFRSDSLSKLTSSDVEKLVDLKITCIVDYRGEQERLNNEDVFVPHAKHVILDPIAEIAMFAGTGKGDFDLSLFTEENAKKFLAKQNIDFVESERGRYVYKNLIKEAAYTEHAFVHHCSAGKDRTGYGAAMLLLLLGVSRKDVLEDYLLTNKYLAIKPDNVSSLDTPKKDLEKVMKYFEGVSLEYLEPALDLIDNKYGGILEYAYNQLELEEKDIVALRHKYLEGY